MIELIILTVLCGVIITLQHKYNTLKDETRN